MHRSAGVTVISILSFMGSLFTLLMAGLMLLAFTIGIRGDIPATASGTQLPMRALLLIAVLIYVVPAAWGIATSIGLWRLKNWARISIIVFAVFLTIGGVFGGLISVVLPIPATPAQQNMPEVANIARIFIAVVVAGELGVGLWWLIYFTRKSVQAQFSGRAPQVVLAAPGFEAQAPVPSSGKQRPVSMTVIACFLLLGAAGFPLAVLMHTPLIVFGKVLTGAVATGALLLLTAANLSIGIGLLKLWPAARTGGIVYFLFNLLNSGVSALAPGATGRLQAIVAAQPKLFGPPPQMVFPPQFFVVTWLAGALVALIPLYFLITRKTAFESREA